MRPLQDLLDDLEEAEAARDHWLKRAEKAEDSVAMLRPQLRDAEMALGIFRAESKAARLVAEAWLEWRDGKRVHDADEDPTILAAVAVYERVGGG